MNDYDEFKIWYTQKAPDESEVTMVDMAAMAWQAARAASPKVPQSDLEIRCKVLTALLEEHVLLDHLDWDEDDWCRRAELALGPELGGVFNEMFEAKNKALPQGAEECADCMELITERDDWEERATILAEAVGQYFDVPVGEHTSANCPISEAMKILDGEYKTRFSGMALVPVETQKDAERYRFIRNKIGYDRYGVTLPCGNTKSRPEETDAAIDAAMLAATKENGE